MNLMTKERAQQLVDERGHWHHTFEIYPGIVTPGSYEPEFLLNMLQLPSDLNGTTVLEVGPSDGAFALELHKRGAKVTCVDYRPKDMHGFATMEELNDLSIEYRLCNVYDVTKEKFGEFDTVLFLGVLYHLPDMMRALSVLRQVCKGKLYLETEYDPNLSPDIAAARYYVGDTLNGDYSNFWAPNERCVRDMCVDTGFAIDRLETWGTRLFAECQAVQPPVKHTLGYGTFLDIR